MMNKNICKYLEDDVKYKLERELTKAEKEFFKWIAEKHMTEQEKRSDS